MRINAKKTVLIFLLLSLLLRILILFFDNRVWWDAAVYIGMAKVFVTGTGLWEAVRPPFWPLLLAGGLLLRTDIALYGHLLQFAFVIGTLLLVYLIARRLTKNNFIALSSILLLSCSTFYLFWSARLYTSIPATFFLLSSLYLLQQKHFVMAGLSATFAVLTRYPIIIFVLAFELFLLQKLLRKEWKPVVLYTIPLVIGALGTLAFNYSMYGNA
ncbi:hypothetical protein GF342_05320, partial [Candidatus Woesearchaeota archaeon]|nr:hypothetical protein [Candidatus Woesearchaeota archaeon]